MKTLLILCLIVGSPFLLRAQQLVYKPINPAFGGETFNYQWLLSSANAQNPFDDSKDNFKNYLNDMNSLDSFTQSLNRQILSQLTSKMLSDTFGGGQLKPGRYLVGSLYLDVSQTSQGLLINILDTTNGDQSQIIIPGH